MPGHTFDDIAKALATGASRRSVLKAFGVGLLGTLAGTTLGPRSAEAACVNQGKSCAAQKCCAGLTCTNQANDKFCCASMTANSCTSPFTCSGKTKPTSCGSPTGQCGCFQASP